MIINYNRKGTAPRRNNQNGKELDRISIAWKEGHTQSAVHGAQESKKRGDQNSIKTRKGNEYAKRKTRPEKNRKRKTSQQRVTAVGRGGEGKIRLTMPERIRFPDAVKGVL